MSVFPSLLDSGLQRESAYETETKWLLQTGTVQGYPVK